MLVVNMEIIFLSLSPVLFLSSDPRIFAPKISKVSVGPQRAEQPVKVLEGQELILINLNFVDPEECVSHLHSP